MLRTQSGLRVLGPADLPETLELLAGDPVVNVFVDYRARITQLDPRWMGGEMWGYFESGRLVSVCHAAANLVPAQASCSALDSFVDRGRRLGRRCSTIVGPADAVRHLWSGLSGAWTPPRELRWHQPHLETRSPPDVESDPMVRRTTIADLPLVYPASVAMYTEEVGVSPEAGGGADLYRTRVAQLIGKGWSFARIEGGHVAFKAEVAAVTPHACQIQWVYVDPARRGQGLAVSGMAAVVDVALREIAPVVSLYVNEHTVPARRAYARVGFTETAQFATIMW